MATLAEVAKPLWFRRRRVAEDVRKPVGQRPQWAVTPPVEIAPNDPILAYFLSAPGPVELERLHLDSPALRDLRAAGVTIVIPLVTQGDLIGLLNLGSRLSQQEYSTDDRRLLNDLATQAAPAVRVAQLVAEQQAQARARERIEQELRIARLIQQTLLPKEVPMLPGWHLAAYYQPARAVGGDFYDFISYEDGRLGLVIGDVTDKGVPAALVMATTRSILRAAAQSQSSPGAVLQRANDLLCPDIPPKMFVTCLYAILEPSSGRLRYANAGHDLPYQRRGGEVIELRARGMPLGLMPGMSYEEKETLLAPGDRLLLYSDGLVEAHNQAREMFSFPRLMSLIGQDRAQTSTIDFLLDELTRFTGPDWEQEDDVTLVTIERVENAGDAMCPTTPSNADDSDSADSADGLPRVGWRLLDEFSVRSEQGNERAVMQRVEAAVGELDLPAQRLEQLKTAVAEATMNAMEHGNHYRSELPVYIQVLASLTRVLVRITDQGGSAILPELETPDIEAKLAERQTPRGWGLFLIKNLVDEMHVSSDASHHTIELGISLEGENYGH